MRNIPIAFFCAFLTLCGVQTPAQAAYPEKSITVIIPFSPGGGGDQAVRLIERDFMEEFGVPLTFVYKPGADGAIGYSEISTAKPDGYTIGAVSFPHLLMNNLRGAGQYTLDQFDYIGCPVTDNSILVTARDGGAKTFAELLERAKANPNKLSMGAVETLGPSHIPALFLKERGMPVNLVTFNGGPKAVPAVLGGHIQSLMATKGTAMGSLSKFNVLAVASAEREPDMPDVPTLKELGYDITGFIGRGFFAPKGLQPEVLARLREGFEKIYTKPGIEERYNPLGMQVRWVDGDEFRKMYEDFRPEALEAMEFAKAVGQ